jgi:protein involved in polysaccharide export with SLBB domain
MVMVRQLMNRRRTFLTAVLLAGLCVSSGCASFFKTERTRWLSPDKVIKAPKEATPVQAIRMNIGPADQATDIVPNASYPRAGDWTYSDEDYVLGPGDVVDIGILDLFSEGLESVLRRQVSESGFIDLPLLPDRILAEGLTKEGFRAAIIEAYSPDILLEPTVSVTVLAQRQSSFSILGAVDRPSQYNLIRRDMRLLESLALAGGIIQTNIRYVYVIRQTPPTRERTGEEPVASDTPAAEPLPPLPAIPDEPRPDGIPEAQPATESVDDESLRKLEDAFQAPSTAPELPTPTIIPYLTEMAEPGTSAGTPVTETPDSDEMKWRYIDGRWVGGWDAPAEPKQTRAIATPAPSADFWPTEAPEETEQNAEDPFGWLGAGPSGMARVIAIDLAELHNGNPRMNIVIRDKDVIHVPRLEIGEFYVMGEVNRPGAYQLTGRSITVKMAVAAAGNLGGLAWPENAVLVRRVGQAEEQMIPLNLERILRGEDEDIFLKANDVIQVGTHAKAIFMAVLRNAFRMTYGFGFIYDRNFAIPGYRGLDSNRFSRW